MMLLLVLASLLALSASDGDSHHGLQHDLATSINGYDFFFHHVHKLLLTVHGTACYYSNMHDHDYTDMIQRDANHLYMTLMWAIGRNHEVHPTTLAHMREKYEDLLADYHCDGKAIFTVDLDELLDD